MPGGSNKNKILIIGGILLIVILGGVAGFIIYTINQTKNVNPQETHASGCCKCYIEYTNNRGQKVTIPTLGSTDSASGACTFSEENFTLSDIDFSVPLTTCESAPSEICNALTNSSLCTEDESNRLCTACNEMITSTVDNTTCDNQCSSSKMIPETIPESLTGPVIFSVQFQILNQDGNNDLLQGRIEVENPDGGQAMEPIIVDYDPNIHSSVDREIAGTNFKIYTVEFSTNWESFVDPANLGIYTVKFSQTTTSGGEDSWSDAQACPIKLNLNEEDYENAAIIPGEEENNIVGPNATNDAECIGIDIAPENGETPVTIEVTAQPDDGTANLFGWSMDLNCNGQIDLGSGEVFTTEQPTVRKEFTLPEGEIRRNCQIKVTSSNVVDDLDTILSYCESSVAVYRQSDDCGNGTCDTGEECDGTLLCPAGTPYSSGSCNTSCEYTSSSPSQPSDGAWSVTTQTSTDCVERVAGSNQITLTVTIRNASNVAKDIRGISDALPQGFQYNANSSYINGVTVSDSQVTLETSGNSQLITWSNSGTGFTLGANATMTIRFTATAGTNAVTGNQINRVTVTPSDETPVTTQNTIIVAQNCEQPKTGILDNIPVILVMGGLLIAMATVVYRTGFGSQQLTALMDKTANTSKKIRSTIKKSGKSLTLRISQPQKFKEKEIEKAALKKIKDHLDNNED
ncbi:hypothetical protein JW887_04530 [Candidatus Dojkabacteria bacterium]|nr:hypothetical protein [Candidatus Dojkabacteria bacterium]